MKPKWQCKCGPDTWSIGRAATQDGRTIYPWYCCYCGQVTTQQANKAEVADWTERYGEPERVLTATENRIANGQPVSPRANDGKVCEVCGSQPTQYHHWAPYHLFGTEANKWPGAWLCQPCHSRWHRIVTPRMGEKKGKYTEHFDQKRRERDQELEQCPPSPTSSSGG